MSFKIFAASLTLLLAAPGQSTAQHHGERTAQALTPSLEAAALLPNRAPLVHPPRAPLADHPAAGTSDSGGGSPVLVTAAVLAGASLAGLWAGSLVPFPAADDDSRLGVGHLVTAPVASFAAVSAASVLLGHGPSWRGSLLGTVAGVGAGLVASMVAEDRTVLVTYAGIHGMVSALMAR